MKNSMLFFCFLIGTGGMIKAQITLENSFDVKHSYEQTVKSRFFVENLSQMDVQEQLSFRSSKEVKKISIYSVENGQKEVEIEHVEHNSLAPDWLKQPVKTIINSTSTYSLDENGAVYVELPHSDLANSKISTFDIDDARSFQSVGQTDIDNLISSGFGVNYLSESRILISSDRALVTVDNQELYYATEILDENGVSVSKSETWYQELGNEIVPLKKNYFSRIITRQGGCATKLISYEYGDYEIIRDGGERYSTSDSGKDDALDVIIYPNPSNGSKVNIDFGNKYSFDDLKEIELLSTSGKVININYAKQSTNGISMNLNDINNGIYFLRISFKNKVVTKKLLIQKSK